MAKVDRCPYCGQPLPRCRCKRVLTWVAVFVLGTLVAGCDTNFRYRTTDASSAVESVLIADTAKYADVLGVKVRGEIATNRTTGQDHDDAAGWYRGGVAYYYRPAVEQYVTLDQEDGQCPAAPRCEKASGVAAHEVAHALYPFHDMKHWCCMVKLGVRPTYPPPVTVAGQWPICE